MQQRIYLMTNDITKTAIKSAGTPEAWCFAPMRSYGSGSGKNVDEQHRVFAARLPLCVSTTLFLWVSVLDFAYLLVMAARHPLGVQQRCCQRGIDAQMDELVQAKTSEVCAVPFIALILASLAVLQRSMYLALLDSFARTHVVVAPRVDINSVLLTFIITLVSSCIRSYLLVTMVQTGHAVAVAFALNIAAGAATILGGMVVFNKRLVYLANPLSLAVALSISAGVMLFISLAEIFGESVDSLSQGIKSDDMSEDTATGHGWLVAACCTAVGIALIYLIDVFVKMISPEHDHTEIENLENFQDFMAFHDSKENQSVGTPVVELESQTTLSTSTSIYFKMDDMAKKNLQRMGLLSALAIGIHNVPEGIATYAGSIHNSSVGFSLAFGIGLHNIPEGIAVAAPIYFATGSRWRGIMWCVISAVAEPLGGVIAWLAIGDGMGHISEGILYGLVCGIMVCICVKELLPTAYRFAGDKPHLVAVDSKRDQIQNGPGLRTDIQIMRGTRFAI